MTASAIYETPCTKKPQNYTPDQELFMVGSGNSDICKKLVKSIFDFKSCYSPRCSFNGVEQPPVSGDFMVISLKERSSEKQGWWETLTISTVPARRTRDTSMWRGRCRSTALRRWRSSPGLSGSSVKHTGKWWVLTGWQINRCQGRGCKNFPYIMRQQHSLHYDTFNVKLIFHNNSFIDV